MAFDKQKADRAVAFINSLKHTKGTWHGVPFELLPWQDIIERQAECLFIKDGVMLSNLSDFGKIVEAENFSFETEQINFGTGRQKTIVDIFVDSVCDIVISNEKRIRKFVSVSGLIHPKMCGKNFIINVYGKQKI